MKKTFTLFAALLLVVMMNAAHSQSRFSISTVNRGNIRVMIDANRYSASGNTLMVSNLRPGLHTVKVYQQKRGGRNNPQGNGNYQLLYSSRVNVRARYHVDITINRFGRAFFDERPTSGSYNDDDWVDNNWNNNDNNNWDNNNNNNWDNDDDWNTNRPMSTQSFDRFKETLRNETFDNTRLNIAKQVISTNYFTTSQVREVMGFFSFENHKLDIAKYAYQYTTNKRDYFMLADAFTFSSNKDELMQFVQSQK
jgi:hypothetical protein